jgi:hypothetical protein
VHFFLLFEISGDSPYLATGNVENIERFFTWFRMTGLSVPYVLRDGVATWTITSTIPDVPSP